MNNYSSILARNKRRNTSQQMPAALSGLYSDILWWRPVVSTNKIYNSDIYRHVLATSGSWSRDAEDDGCVGASRRATQGEGFSLPPLGPVSQLEDLLFPLLGLGMICREKNVRSSTSYLLPL